MINIGPPSWGWIYTQLYNSPHRSKSTGFRPAFFNIDLSPRNLHWTDPVQNEYLIARSQVRAPLVRSAFNFWWNNQQKQHLGKSYCGGYTPKQQFFVNLKPTVVYSLSDLWFKLSSGVPLFIWLALMYLPRTYCTWLLFDSKKTSFGRQHSENKGQTGSGIYYSLKPESSS